MRQDLCSLVGKRAVLVHTTLQSLDPEHYAIVVDERMRDGKPELKIKWPFDEDYVSGWWVEASTVLVYAADLCPQPEAALLEVGGRR